MGVSLGGEVLLPFHPRTRVVVSTQSKQTTVYRY